MYEQIRIFGPYVALIWSRIGTSDLLDHAARYFIDSVEAHCAPTERGLCAARSSGATTMQHLRQYLALGQASIDVSSAVLAITAMAHAEV